MKGLVSSHARILSPGRYEQSLDLQRELLLRTQNQGSGPFGGGESIEAAAAAGGYLHPQQRPKTYPGSADGSGGGGRMRVSDFNDA